MNRDPIARHDRNGDPLYASFVLAGDSTPDDYQRWLRGEPEPVRVVDRAESAALVAALVELQGAGQ